MLDLGYPTLMLFNNGLDSPVTYYGPHDEVGLKYFLLEQNKGLEETQQAYSKVTLISIFLEFTRDEFKLAFFDNHFQISLIFTQIE